MVPRAALGGLPALHDPAACAAVAVSYKVAHSGLEQHMQGPSIALLECVATLHGTSSVPVHLCRLCRLWVAYSDGDTEEMPLAELMPLLQPPGPRDKKPGAQLEAEYQLSKAGT